ncbi:amidohydrolase [Kordiimonas pumila]|uniref:Amidohydrolase n=1 Tax=Kordiimonas pumila TaxID=2161677 RepID=A0ABV7D064_9PROT|nr:amidohydrolase [Kordiimonas pumila]
MRRTLIAPLCALLSFHAVAQEVAPDSFGDSQASTPQADIIIWGGPIYTANDQNPQVEAIAIKGNTILYAGTRAKTATMLSPETNVIELRGKSAFPGFTDSHVHLSGVGKRALTLNLDQAQSLTAFLESLSDWIRTHPEETVITGSGWIETHWPEKRFPTRWDLDAISSDKPIILTRADHHALVANSAAIEQAGITDTTSIPDGGAIHKNALGEITGVFVDTAQALLDTLIPTETKETLQEQLQTGADISVKQGWTTVHNMSVSLQEMTLLEQLAETDAISLQVYNSLSPDYAQDLLSHGPFSAADGQIQTNAIKLMVDGALGSRGAALLEPYSDANTSGLLMRDKATTLPLLLKALANGIQINTHAIGDKANRMVLDWYQEAFNTIPEIERNRPDPRWRIEHAQILNPADINRFAELGVIASMQPSHAIGDLFFAPSRLGEERLKGAYSWESLIESGALIAGGSDAPVEQGNPFIEFYAATARRALNGYQDADWHPEEAVSRANALKMFTLWPAIASFQETKTGSLEAGKHADISIFTIDLMTVPETEILSGKTAMTIIAGKIAYTAP